jgi:hypothetical protein
MSASAQAHAFYKDISAKQRIWVLGRGGQPILTVSADGKRVFPVWSSDTRIKKIIDSIPAYADCVALSCTWEYFVAETAPLLEQQGILVGVNWAGQNSSGFDLSVKLIIEQVNSIQNS